MCNKNVEKSVSKVENLSISTLYIFKTELKCGKVKVFNFFNQVFHIGKKTPLQRKNRCKGVSLYCKNGLTYTNQCILLPSELFFCFLKDFDKTVYISVFCTVFAF